GATSRRSIKAQLSCEESAFSKTSYTLSNLESSETRVIGIQGKTEKKSGYLNCIIKVGEEKVSQKLKILNTFDTPFEEIIVHQSEPLVVHTENGARSRFLTMNPVSGTTPGTLYYYQTEKDLFF